MHTRLLEPVGPLSYMSYAASLAVIKDTERTVTTAHPRSALTVRPVEPRAWSLGGSRPASLPAGLDECMGHGTGQTASET